jgi:hypothetical protein
MMLAASDMKIVPASASPETGLEPKTRHQNLKLASITTHDALDEVAMASAASLAETETIESAALETDATGQEIDRNGKSDFAAELRANKATKVPLIRPIMTASLAPDISELWQKLSISNEAALRRDGAPPLLDKEEVSVLPSAAELPEEPEGQTINREGKGQLPRMTVKLTSNSQ